MKNFIISRPGLSKSLLVAMEISTKIPWAGLYDVDKKAAVSKCDGPYESYLTDMLLLSSQAYFS